MLEKVLDDPDFNVRWRAAEALTAMGFKTVK
jgi:HEAT repeat protein